MKEEAAALAALDKYDKNHKRFSKVKAGRKTILFEQERSPDLLFNGVSIVISTDIRSSPFGSDHFVYKHVDEVLKIRY